MKKETKKLLYVRNIKNAYDITYEIISGSENANISSSLSPTSLASFSAATNNIKMSDKTCFFYPTKNKRDIFEGVCHNCGYYGHSRFFCPLSYCKDCKKYGHMKNSPKCSAKK